MKRLSSILLWALLSAAFVYGQGGLGSIAGRITDATGAVIGRAKVIVTNADTNVSVNATSTANGDYVVLDLVPGSYALSVEAPGFKKFQQQGITLRVSDRLTVNVPLEVGAASETISISADALQLRTEDAQNGEVVNNKFIENLPQLNRDPLQLLRVAGNVQGSGTRAGNNGSDTRINGGRTSSVEYFVDGIPAGTGRGHNVSGATPNQDDVAELKVITNGVSAEYGRISGGLVELVTKSGTNQLHGQLFEYIQNDAFNANSWNQNALGGTKTAFRQNDFGFTLGGPIALPKIFNGRNRTFFYTDYRGYRFTQSGSLQVASVPTAAERAGDFSQTMYNGVPTLMYDPDSPQVLGSDGVWIRTQLLGGDGKHVPQSRISPVSKALLDLLPLPNTAPVAGSSSKNNFIAPTTNKENQDSWSFRLDQVITSNQRFFGRFGILNDDNVGTRFRGLASTAPESHIKGGLFTTVNYDWSVKPTLLLNVRVGAHHDPFSQGNRLPPGTSSASIPFDPITRRIMGTNFPDVNSVFMGGTKIVDNDSLAVTNSTTYNDALSMTKVLNRHTLKFGYEHRRYYDNFYNSSNGQFVFQSNPTNHFAVDNSWNDLGYANGLGPTLLGINDRAIMSGATTRAMNVNYNGLYVQDDFKVSPKLTLNLGLRWDLESPSTERHDKLYFWDQTAPSSYHINPGYNFQQALMEAGLPNSLPTPDWVKNGFPNGAVRIANTPEFKSRTGQSVNPHQFGPRIGLAYQLTPKTVIRASYGLFYLSTTGDPNGLANGAQGIALADSASAAPGGWHASNDGLRHLISNFSNPYPFPDLVTSYSRDNATANRQASGGIGPGAFSRQSHQPHEQDWHIGVQRQLPNQFLIEADYSGNRGLGLLAPNLISRFPKPLFQPGNAAALTTPVASPTAGQTPTDAYVGPTQSLAFLYFLMPYYGTVNVLGTNIGSSYYNSMNVRLEKRYSQGLTLLLNYTLSRNTDNVGGPEANNGCICGGGLGFKKPQSVDTVAAVYGLSALDETHRLALTYSYELPIGRGKPLLGNPQGSLGKTLLDYAIGGWEFSGTSLYRSGRPLFLDNDNTNVNNNVRAEYTAGSWATSDHNLANSNYKSDKNVLYGPLQQPPASTERRFDPNKVVSAKAFTYGTLPAVYGAIRQPGNFNTDLSLMKKFPIWGEGRFLQIRGEASNAFNIRGFGTYNTTVGSDYFGLITAAGNQERRMQISARFVF